MAQQSTASMGRFDKMNKNEKKMGEKRNTKKKSTEATSNFTNERNKQHEIMFRMFGSEQKNAFNVDKATRKAQVSIERNRGSKRRMGGQQNHPRKKTKRK